ncbi:unnamed protein product, partial [Mesorhabditis belari]|uniref:Uncharacterized protein n=1 Tax=Mesorhabditis belari TaxID=2138241 RepID=A0AAF3EB99_9BILA
MTSSLLCDGCSGLVKDLFMWKDVDGTAKTVALRGYLRCRQQPYTEGKLKLYDHDTYSMDEKMSETVYPDKDGHFYIKGTGYEERLNPRLYIYHNCGSLSKWCYYKTYFAIPQSRLVHGEFVTTYFI